LVALICGNPDQASNFLPKDDGYEVTGDDIHRLIILKKRLKKQRLSKKHNNFEVHLYT
jgi:hypothetical protein